MPERQALATLKAMSQDLVNVDYEEVLRVMRAIRRIPLPIARLQAHTAIDRVRKNNGADLFTDVHNQLSYIKDPNVLAILTDFGRANKPHQALFYGSVDSTIVGTPRLTALAETSSLFQDPAGINLQGEVYTISRWRNTQDLFLAEIVFSQDAIIVNPDIRRAFERQQQFAAASGEPDIDLYNEFLVFVSDQFARPKATHHDYKISTAYTELALQSPDIQGIAFPSVQTSYYGQNVVFPPAIVDQYLRVDILSVQRFHKNGQRMYLNNVLNCTTPQNCLTNITWVPLDPQHVATDQYIQQFLAGQIL